MGYRILMTVLFLAGLLLLPAGVLGEDTVPVAVSIAPQQYFVEQIGGQRVKVTVMVPPGANPHVFEPKPRQMVELSRTRIYFTVGVAFEKVWLPKFTAVKADMQVVATDAGITKISMQGPAHMPASQDAAETGRQHATDEDHDHDHGGLDPHIWLDPALVKVQAAHILEGLQTVDGTHREFYQTNYQHFIQRLDTLDKELKHLFTGRKGAAFMVMHPSWGYFAKAYGLVQVPVEFEGKAPKPAQLQALITLARTRGIKVLFVQPQFSSTSAKVIAKAIGGKVIFADPLAADWEANLRHQAAQIAAALR